jgi:uncharacterized membrane protein
MEQAGYPNAMRMRVQSDLIWLNIVTLLLIAIITLFPSSVLRVILGLPFILIFPGYVLTAALFPRRSALDGLERLALSFGLSITVVSLIGLALNYTPWGIRLYPVLISLTVFIAILSLAAWYRRRRLATAERFALSFRLSLAPWRGQSLIDRVLFIILIMVILGALGTLGYTIATPQVGEKFTEFYILGLDGKAIDYPKEMKVGEQGRVVVGIINREQEQASYRVKIMVGGRDDGEVGPLMLGPEERWEEVISFTLQKAGSAQKVEFLLYRGEESQPYRELHLWVDVVD